VGREAKRKAIGPVIDRDDLKRGFSLEDTPPSRQPGRTEARG
jgi:hypothetical protein